MGLNMPQSLSSFEIRSVRAEPLGAAPSLTINNANRLLASGDNREVHVIFPEKKALAQYLVATNQNLIAFYTHRDRPSGVGTTCSVRAN